MSSSAASGPVAGAPAATSQLEVLGRSDLGGKGLNGDVAVVGDTAIVGGGLIPDTGYHTERYTPLPCLATSVKVVDRGCLETTVSRIFPSLSTVLNSSPVDAAHHGPAALRAEGEPRPRSK